jgi:hypothetical protein
METKPKTWDIWRDGRLCGQADSYQNAQRIVTSLQRTYPTSSFRVQYIGKNLGVRREEEYIG